MPAEIALPLGILVATLTLFVGGLVWARVKDRQDQRHRR